MIKQILITFSGLNFELEGQNSKWSNKFKLPFSGVVGVRAFTGVPTEPTDFGNIGIRWTIVLRYSNLNIWDKIWTFNNLIKIFWLKQFHKCNLTWAKMKTPLIYFNSKQLFGRLKSRWFDLKVIWTVENSIEIFLLEKNFRTTWFVKPILKAA